MRTLLICTLILLLTALPVLGEDEKRTMAYIGLAAVDPAHPYIAGHQIDFRVKCKFD
jgi:hypothetical protein